MVTGRGRRRRPAIAAAILAAAVLSACGVVPAVVTIEPRLVPPDARPAVAGPQALKVAVAPFSDQRADRVGVGRFVHLWRQETRYRVVGDDPGRIAAELFIDYFRRERNDRSWLDLPEVAALDGGPDLRISGRMLAFDVTGNSWLLATRVRTTIVLELDLHRPGTGHTARVRFEEQRSTWVLGFDPEVAEEQLYRTVREGLDHLLAMKETRDLLPAAAPSGSSAEPSP